MKGYTRNTPQFSLCGLNCALCSMHHMGYCPGCGGGDGHQGCKIIRCSKEHESVQYCYLCKEFPCSKYEEAIKFDSFITHKNMVKDQEKAKNIGIDAYIKELNEKAEILKYLLENFNDGRRRTFFCLAVNLLELEDIKSVIDDIKKETDGKDLTAKENAKIAVSLFNNMADKREIVLKLNKKKK